MRSRGQMHRVTANTPARPPGLDIDLVDRAVQEAIRAGEPGGLRVLGYGEVTLVFGWPRERPEFAVKRLPPFRDRAQLARYGDQIGRAHV